MKRYFAAVLSVLMVVSLLSSAVLAVETPSVPIGSTVTFQENGVTYSLNKSTGYGSVKEYTGDAAQLVLPSTVQRNTKVYTITKIENQAFLNQTTLTTVEIPAGVTSIGANAFQGCTALESIVLPESVSHLGEGVFYDCTALSQVKLPSSLEVLPMETFKNCTSLTEIFISSQMVEINSGAFSGCELSQVWYESGFFARKQMTVSGNNSAFLSANWNYDSCYTPDGVITTHAYEFELDPVCDVCGHERAVAGGTTGDLTWYLEEGFLFLRGDGATADYSEEAPAPWGSDVYYVVVEDGVTAIGANAFSSCSSISFVYYEGSAEMWSQIAVAEGNENLSAASCNCDSCLARPESFSHIYSYACDATCDVCGAVRVAADHIYSAECDADCNVCGDVRESVGQHSYTDDSDSVCDLCGAVKFIPGDLDGNEVVQSADAIYLLYHTVFADRYPLPEGMNVDFDGNGLVTSADAIYLLYHTVFPDRYPL